MQTTIVIPAHNEEQTICEVIRRFREAMPAATLCVVDNASSDGTRQAAEKAFAECQGSNLLLSEPNIGKGNAVRRAFMDVDSDIYVLVDADLTYSENDLPILLEPVLRGEYDICVGNRHHSAGYKKVNTRMFHSFGNGLVRGLINFLFKSKLKDIMSGYRVMNKKYVKNLPILSTGFEIETEMTLHALDKKFRIKEIPIDYKSRPKGSPSKLNTISDGINVLKTILWIFKDYKPLVFFSAIALIFFVLGLVAGMPPILEYLEKQWVYRVPLAILATGLMIFSLLSFTIGVVLDTVVKVHRWDYMLRLNEKDKTGSL